MSGGISFGATITGGIQNIAGLLPLLGTQQCEEHIGSALTKGYLYSAATPISIFGSLGVARAGFKTLIACMSGRTWSGANILANMEFEPKGINLSLVMIDKDDKDGRHLVESRLDKLLKELHIDKSRVTVSHKSTGWNVTMILLTVFLSSLSIIPYIHVNLEGSDLNHFSQWTFPILRAVGGFLTASMMQIVIERRISTLTARRLANFHASATPDRPRIPGEVTVDRGSTGSPTVFDGMRREQAAVSTEPPRSPAQSVNLHSRTGDIENALEITEAPFINVSADAASDGRPTTISNPVTESPSSPLHGVVDWVYFGLLLTGVLASVTGYVGCFSVVQNAKSSTGPVSWLCLEAGLSFVRMILWGLNPQSDGAPPLELVLQLNQDSTILPTCNLDDDHIMRQRVLPLTRSNQFLDMITSFAGLVERFTHPDLTLYYTLTRKQTVDEAGKRVLYITIFDHKERTTRVYVRDGTTERLYSTESDVPFIDLRHGLLETRLDKKITSKDDLIAGDTEIHSRLRKHYQSIMDQIHFTIGATHDTTTTTTTIPPPPPSYTIENKWTMKAADTVGARERSRHEEMVHPGLGGTWRSTVERGRMIEIDRSQTTFERDGAYFGHRQVEEMRESLDIARGRWIDRYMEMVTRETRDRFEGETTAMRQVDGEQADLVGKNAFDSDEELHVVVQEGLIYERCLMEKLLVHEVEAWEGLVWDRVKEFIGRNDVPQLEKERLTREWRGNCWKRLDANICAMDARMERVKAEIGAPPSSERQTTLLSTFKYPHDEIRRAWRSVIERLVDTPTPSASSVPGSQFLGDVEVYAQQIDTTWSSPNSVRLQLEHKQNREMVHRLKQELADVEFRMVQGLDRCHQFFDESQLLQCRHSRAKSLYLDRGSINAPLDFYSRALKGNNHAICIHFHCYSDEEYAWFAQTIYDLPSVTSITVDDPQRLPPIQRDTPLFMNSQSLKTFLRNDLSLTRTGDTYVFLQPRTDWMIAVSFVGPSSGNLTFRLKHRAAQYDMTLIMLGTSLTLTIPASSTVCDINLYPIGDSSSQPSFTPNIRNNLVFRLSSPLLISELHDLQLLDEDGNPYRQPSQHFGHQFDTDSIPDDCESS